MPQEAAPASPHDDQPTLGIRIICLVTMSAVIAAWAWQDIAAESREFKFDLAPYYAAWYAAHHGRDPGNNDRGAVCRRQLVFR